MSNRFEKYLLRTADGEPNPKAFDNEAFKLFKELYDEHYGNIAEVANLVLIHTGGWSENEALIEEFKQTGWWLNITK